MKKPLLLLFLLPFASLAQQNFTIKGKLKPSPVAAKALLYYTLNNKTIIDSTDIRNGAFTFKGAIPDFTPANIKIRKPTGPVVPGKRPVSDILSFMLEPGTININSSSDSVKSAKVTGTEVADGKARIEHLRDSINARVKVFLAPYYAASPEQQKDQAFAEPFQKKVEEFKTEMDNLPVRFMRENPDNYYSLLVYKQLVMQPFDPAGTRLIFEGLSPRLKAMPVGRQIQKDLDAATTLAIGQMAPDFTQNDITGKPVKLSDFIGKYVLIDFWASWCAPCRAENPWVRHMYERYKSKNFTVLGISLDNASQKEAWLKAIEDDKLTWTNVSDLRGFDNEAAKKYYVQAIPMNVLVGPDGKILAKNLRGTLLTRKLVEVLGEVEAGK